jgi:outer membrane protein TolC
MSRIILFLLFLFGHQTINAQADSVLFTPLMLGNMLQFHPISRTASLQNRESRMVRLQSKGQFDPKFEFGLDRKEYDDKQYYDLQKYGLSVATWPGIDFKAAYKNSSGVFLNPQATLPEGGAVEIGADANLLRGLLFDERRAALEEAKIFRLSNEADRRYMLNELFGRALSAYWNWAAAFARFELTQQSLILADERLELVRKSEVAGMSSEIDTIEALSLVLNRRMDLEKSKLDLQKSRLVLGSFIWGPDSLPLQLSENSFPIDLKERDYELLPRDTLEGMIQKINETSPELLKLQADNLSLDIARKLALNNILPEATIQYRWITPTNQVFNNEDFNAGQNYSLGLGFELPLFIRKERSHLALNKIKRQEQYFKIVDKQNELSNKLRGSYQAVVTYWTNGRTASRAFDQFERLLDVEGRQFRMGESSLFKVNKRQDDLLKIGFKWIDSLEAHELEKVNLYRISGRLIP